MELLFRQAAQQSHAVPRPLVSHGVLKGSCGDVGLPSRAGLSQTGEPREEHVTDGRVHFAHATLKKPHPHSRTVSSKLALASVLPWTKGHR